MDVEIVYLVVGALKITTREYFMDNKHRMEGLTEAKGQEVNINDFEALIFSTL